MSIKTCMYVLLVIMVYTVGTQNVMASPIENEVIRTVNTQINMFIAYTYTPTKEGVHTTAQIMLGTHNIPLNAFSAELHVDASQVVITGMTIHESLCESQFIIEKSIDNETGVVTVSCGSTVPFMTGVEYMPVLSIHLESKGDIRPKIRLGEQTGFYIHDGYGTKAVTKLVTQSQGI